MRVRKEFQKNKQTHVQALYAATLYEEAMKVTVTVEAAEHQGSMLKLQAAIRYPLLIYIFCL